MVSVTTRSDARDSVQSRVLFAQGVLDAVSSFVFDREVEEREQTEA
jgi:hypothetical protein